MVQSHPQRPKSRQLLLPLLVALAILIAAGMVLTWLARAMLFPAPGAPSTSPAIGREDVEEAELPSRTEAWFLPPTTQRSEREGRVPVLVYTHGNGEIIDYWLDEFEEPRRWGMGVLLVEYPGYGRSPGSPSEASISRTMKEAHGWLLSRGDVDPERLVPLGRSLGGGAAAWMASSVPVAALILESTFSSVRKIAQDMFVPGFIVRDPFDNLSAIQKFPGPILGFHGTEDRMIPYAHAQQLQSAHPNYELSTSRCGHNNCGRDWDRIRQFLRENGIIGPMPQSQ